MGGMHSVGTQFRCEFQAFRRTGFHTQPASFAFSMSISILPRAGPAIGRHLGTAVVPAADAAATWSVRSIRKLPAEIGMRDLDQRFGSLANRLAVQVGDSILGHDVADQAARGDHAGSGIERGHDPRNLSLLRSRRNRDDRLATLGPRCSAKEIDLPADAAIKLVANRIGTDLPGQIDLHRGIDGHHLVVAGDQSGVVGIGGGVKLKNGIVFDKLEQPL